MYGHLPLGSIALPSGGMADVTDASLRFLVEEEEMMTYVGFSGVIANANVAAQSADFNLVVDGTNATTLPIAHKALAASSKDSLSFGVVLRLTKGAHVVKLQANASVATDVTIDGAAFDCRLIAQRLTGDAVLAHGVDAKTQVVF